MRKNTSGFTIVELLIVIVIIGILATLTLVVYGNIERQVRDKVVLADMSNLDTVEARYVIDNNSQVKIWNSASGVDSALKFTPSPGNVLDVSTNGTGYCVRAYNPSGSAYNSLATAANRESQPGACVVVVAPVSTNFVYTGALQTFTVPAGVTTVILEVTGGGGGGETCFECGTGSSGGYAKGTLAVVGGDILNITVGSAGYDASTPSSGTNTQINRPASSALLIGGAGGGAYGSGYNGVPGQGYTYAPITNATTTTGTVSWPAISGKAKVTYTPGA